MSLEQVFDGFVSVKNNEYFLSTEAVAIEGHIYTDVIGPSVYTIPEPKNLLVMIKSDVETMSNNSVDEKYPYHEALDKLIASAESAFLSGNLDEAFLKLANKYQQHQERKPGERYFSFIRGTAKVPEDQYSALMKGEWDDIADQVTEKYFVDMHIQDDLLPPYQEIHDLVSHGVRISTLISVDAVASVADEQDDILKTIKGIYGYLHTNNQLLGTFYDSTENRSLDMAVDVINRLVEEFDDGVTGRSALDIDPLIDALDDGLTQPQHRDRCSYVAIPGISYNMTDLDQVAAELDHYTGRKFKTH